MVPGSGTRSRYTFRLDPLTVTFYLPSKWVGVSGGTEKAGGLVLKISPRNKRGLYI